jgi:hypothetical protein
VGQLNLGWEQLEGSLENQLIQWAIQQCRETLKSLWKPWAYTNARATCTTMAAMIV